MIWMPVILNAIIMVFAVTIAVKVIKRYIDKKIDGRKSDVVKTKKCDLDEKLKM